MKSAGKTTAGHGVPLFGMKMILERRDEIFTREKYGEIAQSLEQAGLLLRDAGREKETEEENERGRSWGGNRK